MGVNKTSLKKQTMASRRAQVSEMRFRLCLREQEIADRLGVSQPTVARDIRALLDGWAKVSNLNSNYHVSSQLAEYAEMKRDAALAFQQDKDPRWIAERTKMLEREARLLGLEAPTRQEYSGPDGGPIECQVDLEPGSNVARLCHSALAGRPGAVLQDGDSVPEGFAQPE